MKFWRSFQKWSWENRLLFMITVIALLPVLLSLWPQDQPSVDRPASVDTFIPKGFVLIPIELSNYEALDSILGRFAYVDLFSNGESNRPARLIARHVRLLRAPQNPSRFAVLVPETESAKILSGDGTYSAVVRTPTAGGTEFVNPEPKMKRKIVYEGDRR